MHILHLPRFWKHKETKEVIDHLTYSDLKGKPQSFDFDECDENGKLLNEREVTVENTGVPEVTAENEATTQVGNENTEATVVEEPVN